MGIADFFSDLLESLPSWPQEVEAEAPPAQNEDEVIEPETADKKDSESSTDDKEEGGDDAEADGDAEEKEGGDDAEAEDDEEEEEEEEEEDEPEDPKPRLEEECARSSQCIGYKHHYQECVERVTAQHEDEEYKGPKEDCVEEFFHLQHCATQCAAPKLFKLLK